MEEADRLIDVSLAWHASYRKLSTDSKEADFGRAPVVEIGCLSSRASRGFGSRSRYVDESIICWQSLRNGNRWKQGQGAKGII